MDNNLSSGFAHLMQNRFACKNFNGERIPQDKIDYILEQSNLTPTSFGLCPYKILLISNPEKKRELAKFAWGIREIDKVSHLVIVLSKKTIDEKYLIDNFKGMHKFPDEIVDTYMKYFKNFVDEDFKIHSVDEMLKYTSNQSYILLATILYAAEAVGVQSCPIEGFNKDKTTQLLKTEFGVDTDEFGLSYMVTLGYGEKGAHYNKSRYNLSEIVEIIE